jgi:hypothetical protein
VASAGQEPAIKKNGSRDIGQSLIPLLAIYDESNIVHDATVGLVSLASISQFLYGQYFYLSAVRQSLTNGSYG